MRTLWQKTLADHREHERRDLINRGGSEAPLRPLTVWTSTRRRTVETAESLAKLGYKIRQRRQLSQLNPGICERLSEAKIRAMYPGEVEKHETDPYHHRYPRAEVGSVGAVIAAQPDSDTCQSYHDLAVRLEPIILELEREQNDLLIIAHDSVLKVLYGYLMACTAADIPRLEFPRNEIVEVSDNC